MPSESKDAIDRDVEEPGHLVALCHSDPAWAASRLRVERAARRKAEQTLSTIADNGCITKTEITCADVLDSPEEWCMPCFAALEIRSPAEGDIDPEGPEIVPKDWPYPDVDPSTKLDWILRLTYEPLRWLEVAENLDKTGPITTISHLLAFSAADLRKTTCLSLENIHEIRKGLAIRGMHLKGEGPDAE